MGGQKSVLIAYILWLFGGIVGLHHFYLKRDRHAFVWWSTLAGCGIGWFGEVFRIPRYVRDANEDPVQMKELLTRMRRSKRPPFSINRFSGMLMVGYMWAQVSMQAIPGDEVWGLNLRYLNIFVPFVASLAVWTVGNIGWEQGSFKWALFGAYAAYPLRYYVFDESLWTTAIVLASALAFDTFAKEWRIRRKRENSFVKRTAVLGFCACLYLGLWCSYLYFHGTVTTSDGEEIPIYEVLHHFFTSPWWLDVKQCLYDTYSYAQHHGWYEVWKQIIDLSDPLGEQNAFKVLGVSPDSTQSEITATWRKLSRENHPDKVKDEALRRAAQEKFMEIQQAYEILSKSKHRRQRRNKKDNSEATGRDDL